MSKRTPYSLLVLILGLVIGGSGPAAEARAGLTARMERALDAPEAIVESSPGRIGVWVRFADRGLDPAELDAALRAAGENLAPKAAGRRAKMGGPLVAEGDLPLNPDYLAAVEATGARPRRVSRWLNAASFDATPGQIDLVAALPFVAEVDLVARFRKPEVTPTPEELAAVEEGLATLGNEKSDRWSHDYGGSILGADLINLPRAHELGLTGRGVTIGVIDTGYDLDWHESMQALDIVATWDFINYREDVSDHPYRDPENQSLYGTQALSIIGAYSPGEIVGAAWEASFILAKTEEIDREVPLEEDNWIAALEWMEGLGVDIVSSGLGYYEWYELSDLDGGTALITLAADMAASRGVTVIVSAGNNNESAGALPLLAPADGRKVISVGSADMQGYPTSSSSRGPTYDGRIKPDVLGCGSGITVASWYNSEAYLPAWGSNYATAQVAGVAALMLQLRPDLTPLQVREALRMTASRATYPDNSYGWGLIDAFRAVAYHGPVIDHQPIRGTDDYASPLVVEAMITSREGVLDDDVNVTWRTGFQAWRRTPMNRVLGDLFRAELPAPAAGAVYQYYIEAADNSGAVATHPLEAPTDLHLFVAATDPTPPTLIHYYLPDQLLADWPPVVTAVADDAYGLAGVDLYLRVNGGVENGPFPFNEGPDDWSRAFPMAAGMMDPGDEVTYRIVATDASARANSTAIGPFTFRVVDARPRVLLIDDTTNAKAAEGDRPVSEHAAAQGGEVGNKSSVPDILAWLTETGHSVDVIAAADVKDGTTSPYSFVVLTSGANYYPVSFEAMRNELIHYVGRGGRLVVEGGETAYANYPEFSAHVLKIDLWWGEGGYTLVQAHGHEEHPLSHRPYRLPDTLELQVPDGYLSYVASDVVVPIPEAVAVYNTGYSASTGGTVAYDENTGIDGGQIVYFPFNFEFLKPVMARMLLVNAMTWLEIREPAGPSSITGRVLLADAANHAGTTVAVDSLHTTSTAADGTYTIPGLWGGDYRVTASRDGYGPRGLDVSVVEGQAVGVGDITLFPIVTVEETNSTVTAIPDNDPAGIASPVEVTQAGTVQGLSVTVDISHYSINNLVVKLVSPGGTEVTLHNRTGGTTDDLAGSWPEELTVDGPGALSDFLDQGAAGTWQLVVSDNQFGAVGRLNGWTLGLQVAPEGSGSVGKGGVTATRIIGNSPNPFNPRTVISFELGQPGPVRLEVYDIRGRLVRRIVDGDLAAGIHRVTWDGLDGAGRSSASGIYFTKLVADGTPRMGKMLLVR